MTKIPPYFAAQMEEQKKWDEGFKAGISEVLYELEAAVEKTEDLEGPTKVWVKELSAKITQKYL